MEPDLEQQNADAAAAAAAAAAAPPAGAAAPDQTAELAALQAQLDQAIETTRGALRAANPVLPAEAFTATTLEGLTRDVQLANAAAEAALTAAAQAEPPKRPIGFTPGPAARQPATAPEGVTGIDRIRFGLANRST
jgi:hypothetical protein